jgi:serine/threonine-protein kinase
VQVFDCGERDGLLYVAEELVAGTTLAQRLADRPLPPDEAARLLETLARALHHVHAHGIIHRNLKPRVVLLSAEGVPKVGSFDLAVLPGKQPGGEEGVLMGTPAYMAPEQLVGDLRRITPATDVHALGAILYETLTGVQAFPPGTEAVSVQVQSREPQPPSRLRPGVPRPLEWVCLKCLQKDPVHRYRSAADLADDLRRFLDGKRVRPGSPGLWRRLLGWFRRPH